MTDDREERELRETALRNAARIVEARQKAERELLEAKEAHRKDAERLRAVFEQAAVGIAIADLEGRFLETNRRFCEILGYSEEELKALDVQQITHPEERELTRRNMQRLLRDECNDYRMEKRYLRRDGAVVWSLTTVTVLRDANQRVDRFLGVIEDISQRKEIEHALQEETRALEALNRAGATLVGQLDLRQVLQAVTDAGREISGAQFGAFFYNVTDESGGAYMLYTLSGAPREAFERFGQPRATPLFAPTFNGSGVIRSDDVTRDPRYGQWAPHRGMPPGHLPVCSYLALPVISRSGDVIGGLFFGHAEPAVFSERTEHMMIGLAAQAAVAIDNARLYEATHKAYQERESLLQSERAARSEAEHASAMKDDFLATLSHELRTPLTAILGWSQLLRRSGLSEADRQQGLETIERNARMQTQLIEDLLDMSRITSGKLRLDIQSVDPLECIEAAIESLLPAVEAKGIRLQRLLDPSAGPVSGDPGRLQQIVWNLLSNAIKFTAKGGKVQILLRRVNSHVEIAVADTGIGIKRDFLPYVFDRFRQADASTTRSAGGLGLGLAIVKQLAAMHGGSVEAASDGENRGATFTVQLPLSPLSSKSAAAPRAPRGAPASAPPHLGRPDLAGVRVLVVDDADDSRVLIERVLADCKAHVFTAAGAEEALAIVRTQRPDVLVSDIGMPILDGYQLLRSVRALGPDAGGQIPAIALTAFARPEDRTRALRAGFIAHLAKPIEPAELMATIASISGRADTWSEPRASDA